MQGVALAEGGHMSKKQKCLCLRQNRALITEGELLFKAQNSLRKCLLLK